uniref:glucuronosyltransferase n=1 Tax=Strongyloides papillosus TaxID=174720 RepID=A0A0N5BTV7_STREA
MSPFSEQMTYKERLQNLFAHHFGLQIDKTIDDSSFIVINSNPFLDIPIPKTPKIVEVSDISTKDPKPLDEYWNKILSLRNKAILVSFETYAKTIHMPDITELSFRGVPAVLMLSIADQLSNSKLVERRNFGIIMKKIGLKNSDILVKNIKAILDDETYSKNAKMVSRRLNKKPIGSKRFLIESIEFSAEFGKIDMFDLASCNMG